ncbi:hypothetical protein CO046_03855 [Candidatus Peregrinibacteria bacterium CG_4_9_14_0_2_um_filter_53_11]|nr:MAG: hypothetical protein CO046_03855 [Candidatus Peregrinibacteria bacterium CG_4_9_14_0_2_um_filter_53_11]
MSGVKRYNFEKYSVLDIKAYLEGRGYGLEYIPPSGSLAPKWHVLDSDIYVDVPVIDINGTVLACIRFQDYPRTEKFEESKKLFGALKRKFQRAEGEELKTIKDADKLEIRDFRKGT